MPEEKILTIPLREAYKKARVKRASYAARMVKGYLRTHLKAEDIKLGEQLNKKIWEEGTKKPPSKVRVKAVLEGKTLKAELLGFEYKEFKAMPKAERKGMKEKLMQRLGPKSLQKEEEEKMAEEGKTAKEVREEKAEEEKKE